MQHSHACATCLDAHALSSPPRDASLPQENEKMVLENNMFQQYITRNSVSILLPSLAHVCPDAHTTRLLIDTQQVTSGPERGTAAGKKEKKLKPQALTIGQKYEIANLELVEVGDEMKVMKADSESKVQALKVRVNKAALRRDVDGAAAVAPLLTCLPPYPLTAATRARTHYSC